MTLQKFEIKFNKTHNFLDLSALFKPCGFSYLDYFSVYIELVRCSGDLFPADWAQAGHASVPVALQLDEIPVTELGTILQLRTQTFV